MKQQATLGRILILVLLGTAALPATLPAQTTLSQKVEADTFVSSGQPAANFGTLGAVEIAAPTTGQPRTEESLIRFNTASINAAFNAQYGPNNWAVTSITLGLFSNVSTAGQQPANNSFNQIAAGGFELDWLSNDSWSETGITWNTLPSVLPGTGANTLASLGSFNWSASGSSSSTWTLSLDPNLVSDINNGGEVSILGQPTAGSTVGYLFNSQLLNPAQLNVTVNAVPEPSATVMIVGSLIGLGAFRRWKTRL